MPVGTEIYLILTVLFEGLRYPLPYQDASRYALPLPYSMRTHLSTTSNISGDTGVEILDVGLMSKTTPGRLNKVGTRVERGYPQRLSIYTKDNEGCTISQCYEIIPIVVSILLLMMMQYDAIGAKYSNNRPPQT